MLRLSPVTKKFILHWGEMGTRWGVNRTVAQVHALLYLSPRPLNADDIAGALTVARSNVSTTLRELEGWRIVKAVHLLGDRREHYESMKDVWEMFQVILDERKRREIDPTLVILRACLEELDKVSPDDTESKRRLVAMLEFFETMTSGYEEFRRLPTGTVRSFVGVKGKLKKLLRASPSAGQ